ncbi:MAG TPA: S46 family peptidase [Thermoanaerobaculia bacterium]|nr:S46 family peptidase [Thermoanaerobaculia bacterium]
MFDGNIHSIAGAYFFDPELNRTVAVHPAVMVESLDKVYRARRLLEELGLASRPEN